MKSSRQAPHSGFSAAVAWSGDGRLLACCSEPGRIVIVYRADDATARERGVPIETDLVVDALALSHEGEWLAVAGSGSVALWWHDVARQHAVAVTRAALPGDPALPTKLTFAPDSRSLAIAQGSRMLLLRLDLEALRPTLRPSTLRIRAEGRGRRWDFVLDTPAGQLTVRQEAPPKLDPESLLWKLRPALVVINPESLSDKAGPTELLDAALAPLRRRLLPTGLGDSQAMRATDYAVVLDVDPALAAYPWELLLTGLGATPLAVTHGLLRVSAQTPDPLPTAADAPMHTLLLSTVGATPKTSISASDHDDAQAARLAAALRDAGELQGLIHHQSRINAREAVEALLARDWRLLVLIGTPNSEGEMELGDGAVLGYRELRAMRRAPDAVLLLGGDFRRQAALMRQSGVAVCIASGWPMETESLWCFFSEFLRVMRGGDPLIRAVQMARQYAHTRSAGTAWALEVHGDPLSIWPALQVWRGPAAPAGSGTEFSEK